MKKLDSDEYLLNENFIFHVLNGEERKVLKENYVCYNYKKGDIIFQEKEVPSGLICLLKGKVKIYKEGVGGRDQIIRMAKSVGFIGYRALFARDKYIASAVALEDAVVAVIEKKALYKILESNNILGINFIETLASELGFSNRRTVTLTQKHIRGRLAESLLVLCDTYGFEENNETLKVYLSREDMANFSNMTTSNAIRTLSSFAQEKVISISGRRIKILNIKALKKISDLG